MFADACRSASEYTRPVVTSIRRRDGGVSAEVGSFIVLNSDGWILTAGHVFDSLVRYQGDMKKAEEIEEINRSRGGRPGSPSGQIKMDPSFLSNHSFWWGWDGVRLNNVTVNRQLDIAVGRLEPFVPGMVSGFPVLADPDDVRVGSALCRGGFCFPQLHVEWDDAKSAFKINGIPQASIFFNDCFLSRSVDNGPAIDKRYRLSYIETSTPGIKGQSGGPIFDPEGRMWAMQVSTRSIELGFQPTALNDGRTVVENQFINIGVGLHVATVRRFLDDLDVRYDAEGDDSGYRIIG